MNSTGWNAIGRSGGIGLLALLSWGAGSALGQSLRVQAEDEIVYEARVVVASQKAGTLRAVTPDTFEAEAWSARLTDRDIDARESAYHELLRLARRRTPARLAIESWAVDPTAPELAWTARLALRELEWMESRPQSPHWVLVLGSTRPGLPGDGGTARPLEPEGFALGGDPEPVTAIEGLRRLEIHGRAPFDAPDVRGLYARRVFALPAPSDGFGNRLERDFKLEVQPEGVVLRIADRSGAATRSLQYAAESLSTLLREHPELRHQVPGLVHLTFEPLAPGSKIRWSTGRAIFRTDGSVPPHAGQVVGPEPDAGPPQGILGVKCTPISSEEGSTCCLGPGVGLRVEYRESGTIAEQLDLRRGDILVELCGERLCGVDEISRIMSERKTEEVEVTIIDGTGRERTLVWAPRKTAVIQLSIEESED